ncbi:MAG: hypothetical protein J6Z34_05350, partial [Clostridia bacterium]|nr:hypothetical protein [Clostridia bacterium]
IFAGVLICLHNLRIKADIMDMTAEAILAIFFLFMFMPVSVCTRTFFDKERGKLYFGTYLYSAIRIIKGNVSFVKDQAVIRIGKKTVAYPYKNLLKNKMNLKLFYGFNLTEATFLTELGLKNLSVPHVMAAAVGNIIGTIVLSVLKNNNSALKAFCGTEIYEGEDVFRLYVNITALVNVVIITIFLIKIVLEKMINGKRKQ